MARAAVAAGAPDGCLQVVEEPTIPLIESLMADPGTDLIVATGGTGVVRAAYHSGNPSLGVGPGNVPAFVDGSADLARAAACLAESKSFDNSILCTNESTVIAQESIADALISEFGRHGAHVLDAEATDRIRATCYPEGRIETDLAGKDASTLAQAAGVRVPRETRVLVAPFELIVPEEALAREKLFPLLGMVQGPGRHAWDRGRAGAASDRRRRALSGDPLAISGDDPRLRCGTASAAGERQRARQHRIRRSGHPPGADDDDRHGLLRALFADREPPAPRSHPVDPGRLQLRSGAAVRRLHRTGAVVGDAADGAAPAMLRPCRAAVRRARPPCLARSCGG